MIDVATGKDEHRIQQAGLDAMCSRSMLPLDCTSCTPPRGNDFQAGSLYLMQRLTMAWLLFETLL